MKVVQIVKYTNLFIKKDKIIDYKSTEIHLNLFIVNKFMNLHRISYLSLSNIKNYKIRVMLTQ